MSKPQKHDHILKAHPEVISLDQLCKICHISKRKGKWLLDNDIIPCVDSGKKTRRYTIQTKDVVVFLKQRDAGIIEGRIPYGIFSSNLPDSSYQPYPRHDPDSFKAFLCNEWAKAPDMLRTKEACRLTGHAFRTMQKKIQQEKVKSILYKGNRLIFKDSLIDHMVYLVCYTSYHKTNETLSLLSKFTDNLPIEPEIKMSMFFG